MKDAVPKAIEKIAKDYVNGKTDVFPIQESCFLHWEISSFSERASGKNLIKQLTIIFDGTPEKIAEKDELSGGKTPQEENGIEKTEAKEANSIR